MSRGFVASMGLLAILLLALLCTMCGPVPDDVLGRTQAALTAAGMDWAVPSVDGRDVTLTGVLPGEALRSKVLDLVAGVRGVRVVKDRLELPSRPPSLEVAAQWTDKTMRLTGRVPNEGARNTVVEAAERAARGATVIDELTIDTGAGSAGLELASAAIEELSLFDTGSMRLSNYDLEIEGDLAGPEAANRVRAALSGPVAEGFGVDTDLRFLEAVDLETCQELLTAAMRESRILFATSSAEISPDSFDLLDRLASTAQRCPNADIEVSGHTDSRGDAEMNRALSEARAGSVRDYLVARGVTGDRLVARGYGETRPIGDNATPAGRSQNRRIEFKIQ